MTTLVTGGSGFAGGHLLDRLAGQDAIAGWHRPGSPTPARWPAVSWRGVDLLDRAGVAREIAALEPARIYHIAGAPHVDQAWHNVRPHLETNVLGTHHVLDAVRRLERPCRVLVVTSAMIYQSSAEAVTEDDPLEPSTPYGMSKLAQDQLALRAAAEDHLEVVVARPFNHAGPRQDPGFVISSFARQIASVEAGLSRPEIVVGNLDAERDFTDVRDVVAAYEHLMSGGRTSTPYNVCSGRAIRVGDLLDELVRLARLKIDVIVDRAKLRPSDTPRIVGDATRIKNDVGWTPGIPITRLLEDTLDWWRSQVRTRP